MRAKARSKYITEVMKVLKGTMKPLTDKEKKSFGYETPEEYIIARLEDVRIDKLEQIMNDVIKNNPGKTSAAKVLKNWGEKELLVITPEIRTLGDSKSLFIFHNSYLMFKQDRFVITTKNKRVKAVKLIEELDSEDEILIKIKSVEAVLDLLAHTNSDLVLTVDPYKELLFDYLSKTAFKDNKKLCVSFKVFNALVEAYN